MGFFLVNTSLVRAYCSKVRRYWSWFEKITTTAVLDEDENLFCSGLQYQYNKIVYFGLV